MGNLGMGLALLCALGYTAASLFLKGGLMRGATAGQVNLFANLALALIVQPLWLLDRPEIPNAPLWQPLSCCAAFFLGQVFTFAALARGDVSIATPLLGAKVILVTAINAIFFSASISARWWLAAAAAAISVALIAGGPSKRSRAILSTVVFSLGAATCFSFTDVFVQHWGGAADAYAYMPAMFGAVGVLSLIYYGVTDRQAFLPSPEARPWLVVGGLFLGAQAAGMFLALVWSQDATGANIIYTSRSVWSVVAAWASGPLLGLRDREAGTPVMIRRLAGALLLFAAIILILV